MSKVTPYSNPEHFGLEITRCDDPESSYEFNTLLFLATADGRVFTASDSGCSCPTPFEDYEAETLDELLPTLERVGSLDQAERIFDGWNKAEYRPGGRMVDQQERTEILDWVAQRLAKGAA